MQANGGKGGDQLYLTGEAEGPGGGGGGGYIASTATAVTRQVNGGDNGISNSVMVTEFLPNGATQGAAGTIGSVTFSDVAACDVYGYVLPVKLISFNAILKDAKVALAWTTEWEEKSSHFEIEKSIDGRNYSSIATVFSAGNSADRTNYNYNDALSGNVSVIYYRLKMVDVDKKYTYSGVEIIRIAQETASFKLNTYPNPAGNELRITIPSTWRDKKVRFELYDANGKLTGYMEKNNAGQTETIAMKEMSAGFYVLRATMGGEAARQSVIKK